MYPDKIRLPDFLIADLYKSCLADPDTFPNQQKPLTEKVLPAHTDATASLPKIDFFGENRKNVIIVVNQLTSGYLNKDDLTFLTSILMACQLNIADTAVVNAAKQEVTFAAIKAQFNAVKIILFNMEPSAIKLPFTIPSFQVQNYDGTTIMLAPALADINKPGNEGRLLKTKLWNSLKQVFNI